MIIRICIIRGIVALKQRLRRAEWEKTVARQKFAVQAAAAAAAAAVSTFEMNSSNIEAHSLKMNLTIWSFFKLLLQLYDVHYKQR